MKDLNPIIRAIYRQLYREATPSADFDDLVQNHSGPFFEEHYLPQDRQDEIIREHCERKRLTMREKAIVSASVNLGCSPRGIEKVRS
jgi:hypothetical protein